MDNITGSIISSSRAQLDKTLTITGMAADAKAAGDAIASALITADEHLSAHTEDIDNPHKVTKAQVGLDKVDNTSDKEKPVSTAQATAIADAKKAGTNANVVANTALAEAQSALTKANEALKAAKEPNTEFVEHTNAENPHGVTSEQVGALSLNGGTLTGMLKVPYFAITPNDNFPGIFFYGADGHIAGVVTANANLNKIYLENRCLDTSFKEAFFLPAPSNGRTSNANYNILTDKTPVTIAQGGTGATTADNARKALNAVAMDTLWTNASPTSSFAAQTLNLGLGNYDWYVIAYRYSTEIPGCNSCMTKCGNSARLDIVSGYVASETGIRSVFYESGNLRFENAKFSGAEANDKMIPLYVIGIKGVK